jgi:hypothetical protein
MKENKTNIEIIRSGRKSIAMEINRRDLAKKMTEFSKELGIAPKKNVGKTMLWAAGSIAGYFLIRGFYNNRMK